MLEASHPDILPVSSPCSLLLVENTLGNEAATLIGVFDLLGTSMAMDARHLSHPIPSTVTRILSNRDILIVTKLVVQ